MNGQNTTKVDNKENKSLLFLVEILSSLAVTLVLRWRVCDTQQTLAVCVIRQACGESIHIIEFGQPVLISLSFFWSHLAG